MTDADTIIGTIKGHSEEIRLEFGVARLGVLLEDHILRQVEYVA